MDILTKDLKMITILKQLSEKAKKYALQEGIVLEDFGVTSSMIYAVVKNGEKSAIGVTLTPTSEGQMGCLQGSSIEEIFSFQEQYSPMQRAFCLALINALGQHSLEQAEGEDVQIHSLLPERLLEMTKVGDEVVFVGNLAPVIAKLKENGRKPIVFCRDRAKEGTFSDIFEYEAITKAPIAVITGSSLIGSTIDALMSLSPQNSTRILTGFSAGANPLWFKGTKISHIASMRLEIGFKEELLKNNWQKVFTYGSYVKEV